MMWHGAYDGDSGITKIALHIADITPERTIQKPPLTKRAWRMVWSFAAMAMCLSLVPAAVVLAMRLTLAAAR